MADLLHTPLHARHVDHGGRMVDFAGWSMPVQYTSILDEHRATRDSVTLFDVSHMGRLRFDGPDAAETLDHLLTREVVTLREGGVRYSLMADQQGRVLDDVLVYRFAAEEPYHLLVVNAGNREKILEHLASLPSPVEDFRDLTRETAMIAVQGPRAVAAADPLLSIDLSSLRYYRCAEAELLGHRVLVSRTGYTGEDGCELVAPADAAVEIWNALLDRPERPVPAGLGARDTLRLEAAMPLYGHELSEEISPYQAGLDFAVNLDREFVGRDALARLAEEPSPSSRIGLHLQGKRIAREHCRVLAEGRDIGEVTSGSFSPTLGRPIAMALVDPNYQVPGTPLEVDIRGRREPAVVSDLPFYRREKK